MTGPLLLHQRPGPCRCVGVEIQAYQGTVGLKRPAHMADPERPDVIDIDACLASEITALWREGVVTTGCCCGHGKMKPFIGVAFADIPRMKAWGYVVQPNPCRPGDEDSFWPKTVTYGDCPAPDLPPGYRCDGCDCERAER